ncbi:AAA family ATPase [Streptomyces sp. DSM 42041]|uniref:AAA family ATPase n=1 Tax=Streptomyces hazeniae TaxID=3075538 RepID=A0ABU2NWI0_9ACTN|nr:AAA family ATPase [Streptomyces sp. DSM 42041]MDT0381344.1 AAA family ATPase [Streptomyces sp. DSM 42041]
MQPQVPQTVGREEELARLQSLVHSGSAGRGRSVFLVGEGGIGKSRLAAEATGRAVGAGMRVMTGRGSTIGPMLPFRPLTEALMSLFRTGPPVEESGLGPYRPVLGRLVPDWSTGEHGDESLVVLAEAVLRLLAVVGRDGGCMLVLEDLHDADTETLVVVEYLIDNLSQLPVALLVTTRAEPCPALDLARSAAQRRSGELLALRPLTEGQVVSMVASSLGTEPDQVPRAVVERLWQDSAGNPFLVEELLHGLVNSGSLVQGADGWRAIGPQRTAVPSTLVQGIARRTDRLGPQGRELLSAAAVLGRRFPLSVLQRTTEIDDRSLLSHLHAGVAAQLVVPDDPAPDWYAFRHPLTAEALLAQLTSFERASLSRRAADAAESLHPALDGEWCALVAALRRDAGETDVAARLFTEAGRRALDRGAVQSAISLLEGADELLADGRDTTARADTLQVLLPALAEAGELDRALRLAETLHDTVGTGVAASRLADLHTRLARIAHLAGRGADGEAQVAEARRLLSATPGSEHTASVDVVAAHLALDAPGADRTQHAEKLARAAVASASLPEAPLPHVACQAWEILGVLARERDLSEAADCFERARSTAEEHGLTIPRLYAMVHLGGSQWLADGETSVLQTARAEAARVGAVVITLTIDAITVLHDILRGRLDQAAAHADACLETATRLRLAPVARYLLMARSVAAAHCGDRAGMERAEEEFARWEGAGSHEEPLQLGLARVFCALLEEDRERALRDLDRVRSREEDGPTRFHLGGRHGLRILLDVLSGDAGWDRYIEASATSAGRMRWNRQFVELAHAVLLGRDGRGEEAAEAVAEGVRHAESFPVARHLGLRLVAEAALDGGWGDPVTWLREAEECFHGRDVPAVAGACRALLRRSGVSVRQRRSGTDRIPAALRARGVTVREYEVFQLLPERLSNKGIAARLYISPRTVEKHVAQLIAKMEVRDREQLCAVAADT